MTFALFKMTAGGYHFKKYIYCYLFTVISIVAIETYALSMLGIPNFVILLHSVDYIYIFLFLPKPTCGRRLTKSRVSKSRIYLLVYSLICQFLIIISPDNVFFVSIYLGYKVALLTSLPLGGKNEFAHL
jgi:accessory gene regulator protein AgrB